MQLRQRVFDMEFTLNLEDSTCGAENTLEMFALEEGLRPNTLEVSIPTEYENTKSCAVLNKDDPVFSKQITNLQSVKIECEFAGDYSDLSVINRAIEFDEPQLSFMNRVFDMENEMPRLSEGSVLMQFEGDVNVDTCNINNTKSDTLQMEFTEDFDMAYELEINASEYFALSNFENEHFNLVVEVPDVNNCEEIVNSGIVTTKEEFQMKQGNTTSDDLELGTNEDEFGDNVNVALKILNVRKVVNMENCEENRQGDLKLRSTDSNSKSPAVISDIQPTPGEHKQPKVCAESCNSTVCNKSSGTSRTYICTVCNQAFTTSFNLTRHKRLHIGDRPYKCTVCDKTFAQSGDLTLHKRIHSGDRPYECIICNKTFRGSSALTIHERTHRGDKPYKCTVCCKAFTQLCNLTRHKRIHSNSRPYKCTACNKTFTDSSSLTVHKRLHTGERPFKCTNCSKTFIQSANLTKHVSVHHPNNYK